MGFFDFMTEDIAIDLGTANTLIIHNDKVVIDSPSIVARDRVSGKIIAVGKEANMMQGKTHENIKTIRPLKDGVIADFDASEKMILLACNTNQIFRHSFTADYYLYDIESKKLQKLFDFQVQEPTFSPDGKKIAYAKENNLYVYDVMTGNSTPITKDGQKNSVINGITDWVYEEEFGHAKLYEWTKNSDAIVFVKSDESEVPEMYIPIYGKQLYPSEMRFKYPKAGEKNSVVSAQLFRLDSGKTIPLNLSAFKNYYVPNVYKTAKADEIILITSERTQNASDVLKVNTKTGNVHKLFTETDEKWVDTDNVTLEFLDDNSFIWGSERDGNRHLYWYDQNVKLKKQITKGNWEVTDYYGYNPKTKDVLFILLNIITPPQRIYLLVH